MCTFLQARSKFIKKHMFHNNMHFGSFHWVCFISKFPCFSDPKEAAQTEKKGSFFELGHQKSQRTRSDPRSGPKSSPFRVLTGAKRLRARRPPCMSFVSRERRKLSPQQMTASTVRTVHSSCFSGKDTACLLGVDIRKRAPILWTTVKLLKAKFLSMSEILSSNTASRAGRR